MKKYAAIGHPISHSLSPTIFNSAFKFLNMDCVFEKVDVAPEDLGQFIKTNKLNKEYSGLSVTIPHKENIIKFLDQVSDEAREIGAVNTVLFEEGKAFGENTDWVGVKNVLLRIEDIRNKSILVLGAGGVSRACLYAMKQMGVNKVTVWNITEEKGRKLALKFGYKFSPDINILANVIINATSVGLKQGEVLPISNEQFTQAEWVFDIVYGKEETELLIKANENNCKTIDGREMLLEQAYKQFELFTGELAPKEIMRKEVFI